MAERRFDPAASVDPPVRDGPPAAPRWVKVSGALFVALVLVVVVLHLTGNRLGGPGHHAAPLGEASPHGAH